MDLLTLIFTDVLLYVFAFIFSLAAVIFIHELGHYLAARHYGVRIEKFSLGFGKEIFGWTDRLGTRWVVARWPLGGFVRIFGDVNPDDPKIWDDKKKKVRRLTKKEIEIAFCFKPIWQRALIIAAGPAANLLLTFCVLLALFVTRGQGSAPPVITAVALGTSGYEAGFQLGDEIVSFNGQKVIRFDDVWKETLNNPGVTYSFTILRDGKEMVIEAAPREVVYNDKRGVKREHGRLGITHVRGFKLEDISSVDGISTDGDEDKARELLLARLDKEIIIESNAFRKDEVDKFLVRGLSSQNGNLSDPEDGDYKVFFTRLSEDKLYIRHDFLRSVYETLFQMGKFTYEAYKIMELLLTGGGGPDSIGGVATLGDAAGKAIDDGYYTFLLFISVLSFQIAFINLLPIPLLDGGYLVFLAYEALAGRPLPERVQNYAFSLGLAFLVGIMIFANISDILQFTR